MPKFRITDNVSGKSVVISGDSQPSETEAQQIFSDAGLHAAPAVPAPEGAAPADYANAIDPTKTWLSQHPEQAGSLSHVASSAIEGFKNAYGDAPSAAPIPEWISKYVPPAIPVAAAYQLGNMGLRALGATPGLLQGAVKGQAEVMGFDPTQAYQAGQTAGGMPEAIAGVAHTLPPVVRNPVMPSTVNEPFFGTALTPGRNANKIAEGLRSSLGPDAVSSTNAAANDAAMQAVANEQTVKALKSQTPFDIGNIGETALPHEIGGPLQEAAVANETKMVKARADIYDELKQARNAINTENVNNGILPEDMPAYQKLEEKLQPVVAPNPATASRVVAQNDPGVKKAYQRIWDTVISKEVPLDKDQVAEAIAAGNGDQIITRPVKGGPTPTTIVKDGVETQYPPQQVQYFRKFSNSFDAIDDARRFLGKVFAGKPPEGYEAISGVAHKELYSLLDQLEKEYAGNAQTALQNHWSSATKKLDVFDTKAGKLLTDTQGDTGVLKTSPSEIPKKFFGKGPDAYQNLIDVTGNPALANKQVTRWVSSELSGLSGKQATDKAAKLADMLSHPSLSELRGKVAANVNSKNLADAANEAQQLGLKQASTKATASGGIASSAEKAATQAYSRSKIYENLTPREVVKQATSDFQSDFNNGRISKLEFDNAINKIKKAQNLYGYSTALKRAVIGVGGLGAAATPMGKSTIQYVLKSVL